MGSNPNPRPSPYKGHVRHGRRHLPPMLDLPVPPTLREFRKHALPDFLWLLTMLQARPLAEGPGPTAQALKLGQEAFDHSTRLSGRVFHGCLTDWEAVPKRQRKALLAKLRQLGIYEAVVPESLAHSLAIYPDAPAGWLIAPRLEAGLAPSLEMAEDHLAKMVVLAGDSHLPLATEAIFVWIRGLVLSGKLRHDGGPVFGDILPRYPDRVDQAERSIAETTLRAMFLADFYGRPDSARSEDWAQRFWRANERLFDCYAEKPELDDPPDLEKARLAHEKLQSLMDKFLEASGDTECDLWNPDRHDVLTGMAWRSLRITEHMVNHTALWSEEHGYASIRALFEAYVQMTWMLHVETDHPNVWHEFKDYGRGRNKALKIHTEEQAAQATGRSKELLDGLLTKLEREVNRDTNEEFQAISTAATFVEGVSLQQMAKEVGMGSLYESTMGPASSALHGDWSALDDLYLDRCVHPLHGPHALPRLKPASESNEKLPFLAEKYATWTLGAYYRAFSYNVPPEDEGPSAATS